MLVLRLQRTGRKNLATYRIVVAEKARPVKGKFLEIIGHYLPAQKNSSLTVNQERVTHWVEKGAHPSDTLARLLKKEGMKGMDKYILRYSKKRSKSAPAEEPAAPAVAAAVETPAAETEVAAPTEAAAPAETPATQDDTGEKKE